MRKKSITSKFPDRIELGVGYPWAIGVESYKEIAMLLENTSLIFLDLNFPDILWNSDVPKYKLILEKVKE